MAGARVAARRGRCVAGVAAVLVAVSVVACSGSGGSGASANPSVSASASATASGSTSGTAPVSASAAGSVDPAQVTAESLSDEELGYTVTSVPEGMDAVQAEVVQAYVAYDQFTWRLWLTPAGTGTGMEGAEQVMTDAKRQSIEDQYSELEQGQHLEGQVRTAILNVSVDDQPSSSHAVVMICADRGDMKDYNGAGQDVTASDISGRSERVMYLLRTNSGWKVDSEQPVSQNECTV
ncbi:Uncharacterised protein [Actinomyces howellii]|uniref:Lipoprotein n=1 Tax=Actinomyces howellii TaxID=52771 RepID=A0A448HI30_9ACTO|nr:Uncharacterised protein [Actinomyces howellii]